MFDEVGLQQVKGNQVSLQFIRNGSYQFYRAKWSFGQQDQFQGAFVGLHFTMKC
jgi:hypothetical protein